MIEQKRNAIQEFVGDYRFLSSFWFCDVFGWPTIEHAYQASKTRNRGEQQLIMACQTPGQAKRAGQKVTLRSDWNQLRIHVMASLVDMKFSGMNPMLVDLLMNTYPAQLIEGNKWGDTYWGISNGIGSNHLGEILMARRKQLIDGYHDAN